MDTRELFKYVKEETIKLHGRTLENKLYSIYEITEYVSLLTKQLELIKYLSNELKDHGGPDYIGEIKNG